MATVSADSAPSRNHLTAGSRMNWPREQGQRTDQRLRARLWIAAVTAIAAVGLAWLAYSYRESDAATPTSPPSLPQVVVSKPLVRELDSRLGFLGQFSAVDQVELRAQVGGTLTGIRFKDGTSSMKAISSSLSTRVPTKSGWPKPLRSSRARQRGLSLPSPSFGALRN
jgi:hypothetical protein